MSITTEFANVQPGTLPAGTVTPLGTIARSSVTAYEMTNGEWVAFRRVHGQPSPVLPMVTFGWDR